MAIQYLYGAAVQGIQDFIFQTNELKDVVGASELVETVCTKAFDEFAQKGESVVRAAGNIKHIFAESEKKELERAVRLFPKKVTQMAPGITVSQAVVEWNSANTDFGKAVNELEDKLKHQRNRPSRSTTLGMMGILRSRATGLPVTQIRNNKDNGLEYLDEASYLKTKGSDTTSKLCEKAFGKWVSHDEIPYYIDKIPSKNDWVAIIHADGNGLGQVVQKVGHDKDDFKTFSNELDLATKDAMQDAYEAVKPMIGLIDSHHPVPIRPIVLGGDDVTIICRADLALPLMKAFLDRFAYTTETRVGKILSKHKVFDNGHHLTACAGIAYVKSSFPFYYGYQLAESLCGFAKKDAKLPRNVKEGKSLPSSCLMFHKVQDSFITDYAEITRRELTPQEDISFLFGPYYVDADDFHTLESVQVDADSYNRTQRWTITDFENILKKLDGDKGRAIKSHLRQWMSALNNNPAMAVQHLDRTKKIAGNSFDDRLVQKADKSFEVNGELRHTIIYPTYDLLAIHAINNQVTKEADK